jgi:two-component system NtrC family sensor kinase
MMNVRQAISSITETISGQSSGLLYLWPSIVLLLLIVYVLIKTYRAARNVEKKLAEFSSLSSHAFAGNLQLLETHNNEHKLNKKALGPLARIIDEYAVTVVDKNGFIIYANQKFMDLCEFSLKELIGVARLINDSGCHDDKFWQEMWSAISNDRVWHGELGNNARAGTVYWIDTFIFPLSYISSESEGYICFGTDITAIKQQNTRLKNEVELKNQTISKVEGMLLHSEKMASLGTIAAGIAHEINNPVAFVSSNIEKLGEYLDDLSAAIRSSQALVSNDAAGTGVTNIRVKEVEFILGDYPSLVEETNDGIDRVRKIIKDLKCFSHEQKEIFSSLDIHKCIESSLNLAKSELKYKVDIQKDYGIAIPPVSGSESQLSQVFINLFVNAAHAIDKRGEIRIVTRDVNKRLVIRVSDNGSGIEPGILKNIFEPFFTTKGIGQGTGLGLSISQDIIKRHGGEITVESTKGVGTTFTITLPVSADEASHANVAA